MMGFLGLRPPRMKTMELRVDASAGTDDLAPAAGKKIKVLGVYICCTTLVNLTATLRASLAFGTDHTTDPAKIICCFRSNRVVDSICGYLGGLNLLGEVDEVVRLTNTTFSVGSAIARTVVYYVEE